MALQETNFDGRIGPQMTVAVKLTNNNPYRSKNQLATTVGPHGSADYGYRIVNRCIRRDLLTIDPDHEDAEPRGLGAVVITDKGREFLAAQEADDE